MQVTFTPNFNNNYRTQSKPSFKSNITFDIGGSQREGSCKIYYASTVDDTPLHTESTTVNDLGKNKFIDSSDFINQIVKKIGRVQRESRKEIKEKGYPKEENALKNVTIFLPSYTSNNFAYYLPNHKNIEGYPLKDLNFNDLKRRLVDSGVEVAPDLKIKIAQDAMGTGLAMTKRLYDLGMLKEGKYYTAVITGGGCGISNIEVPDNENQAVAVI